ncbi:hypothetical protein GHT06_010990 [Daphnia sinensis]|uniref:Uncharacterized protein n=1 Tax=Daphnia sinensis TaxID=1820382 RepID=A0AAD5L1Y9_9CRUS|nr:hypothetical protein GHT06_010990 [Daphnia sinensis]
MDVPARNSSRISFQDAVKKVPSKNSNQGKIYSIVGAIWSESERKKHDVSNKASPWCLSQTLSQKPFTGLF